MLYRYSKDIQVKAIITKLTVKTASEYRNNIYY